MWNDIPSAELRQLMDEIEANEADLDLEAMERWLATQPS
jgi:hypothetical protein